MKLVDLGSGSLVLEAENTIDDNVRIVDIALLRKQGVDQAVIDMCLEQGIARNSLTLRDIQEAEAQVPAVSAAG